MARIAAVLHYLWFAKAGITTPYAYAAVLVVLLADRMVAVFTRGAPAWPLDEGMAVPERSGIVAAISSRVSR